MLTRSKVFGLPFRAMRRWWLRLNHRGKVQWHLESPLGQAFGPIAHPVRIAGWVFNEKGVGPDKVFVKVGDRTIPLQAGIKRKDVVTSFSNTVELKTGFEGSFRLGKGVKLLYLIAEWQDGAQVVLCRRLHWVSTKRGKPPKVNRERHQRRNKTLLQEYRKQCAESCSRGDRRIGCDVVIPVYKGLEETRKCLESVYETVSRNQTRFAIQVINDASPEPELVQYLEKEAEDGKITLIQNLDNVGFVATVNRGFCLHSNRHVILLNSDTEVFHNWVDRLLQPFQRENRIATVTPFSNNATICSYPAMDAENLVPQDASAAHLDQLFAKHNEGRAHEVPTGVGFCMAVNRKCLDAIGYFDEELFGKGYGEENDFCQRAILEGWRNLHLCDTYVYHKGSVSFETEKNPLIDQALAVLFDHFPNYQHDIDEYLSRDPARDNRLAVDLARINAFPKERILCITNSRRGGTQQHIEELALQNPQQGRLLLRPREKQPQHYDFYFLPERKRVNLPPDGITIHQIPDFCQEFGITLLEYHQLVDQPRKIMEVPAQTGLPYTFIAHDYFTFCPQISLSLKDGTFCGVPELEECEKCFHKRRVERIRNVKEWRDSTEQFLSGAEKVTTPSIAAAKYFAQIFKGLEVQAIPHKELEPEVVESEPQWRGESGQELTIGVLGALSRIKGADCLEKAAVDAAKRKLPIRFVLIGYGYRTLLSEPDAKLLTTGAYKHHQIQSLMKKHEIDAVWFTAQWPETYSYTLSQAMSGDYPIIAPDIGAFPERLENRKLSLILPWDLTVNEVNDRILTWHSDTTK